MYFCFDRTGPVSLLVFRYLLLFFANNFRRTDGTKRLYVLFIDDWRQNQIPVKTSQVTQVTQILKAYTFTRGINFHINIWSMEVLCSLPKKKKQYNDNMSKKRAHLCCLCSLKSCTMKDSSEGAFLLHLNRAAMKTKLDPLNLQHLLAGQVHFWDFGGAKVWCIPLMLWS